MGLVAGSGLILRKFPEKDFERFPTEDRLWRIEHFRDDYLQILAFPHLSGLCRRFCFSADLLGQPSDSLDLVFKRVFKKALAGLPTCKMYSGMGSRNTAVSNEAYADWPR